MRAGDVFTRRLHGTLAAAAERGPLDFLDLLLTPGVGARTVQSLAMVAEVVHGSPYRFQDPAGFSLAHGGKDRHPYPVPLKVYDEVPAGAQVQLSRPGGPRPAVREVDDLPPEAKFWAALKSDMTMMLGLDGVEDGHTRPMSAGRG